MRRKIGVLALVVAAFGFGQASAQSVIPDGSFVRDSAGNTWLVTGDQRAAVPIREATDEEILALPFNNQWVVAATQGFVALGGKPDWADDPEDVKLTDDPPKVTIKLNSDEVARGETVEITVVGSDDNSLDWIEWEGEPQDSDESVDDPALTTIHRFECNGQPSCTNTMTLTATGQGKFVITARARDMTGQRSDATTELTIR
jgi:hypothetical protein